MLTQKQRKAAKDKATRELRAHLVATVGHCEMCGHDPERAHRRGSVSRAMVLHHIIRGMRPNELCAVLFVCRKCHDSRLHDAEYWPESSQLAVLLASRPGDFNLTIYNWRKGCGPNRITIADVNRWKETGQ